MFSILKISEAASLALHTMVFIAQNPDKMYITKEISDTLNASKDHLAKILKRLERVRLVISTRGPRGGFRLGKKSEDINLIEIYEAVEGPYEPAHCLLNTPICDRTRCILGDLPNIEKRIRSYLYETKLSDLSNIIPRGK